MGLSFLGTGIMRLVNMGLLLVLASGLIFAAYKGFTGHYIGIGRQQVTTEVNKKNQALDVKTDQVNTNIVRHVITETQVIEHHTKDIEYVIRNAPSEPITNVSRARIDGVYEQQRAVREASQKSK